MKPTPFQFLIGSRYTLPLWLGLAAYFWFSHGGDWNAFTPDQQIANTIVLAAFAFAWLMSFPTVFFYEREQAAYRRSAMSPEERWQKKTVRQTVFLVLLLAAAILYFGFNWWKSAPEPEPVSYKAAAAGIGSVSIVATTAYLKVRTWRSRTPQAEQPAMVSWCLPVPQQSSLQVIQLPDYCQRVMTREKKATVSQA